MKEKVVFLSTRHEYEFWLPANLGCSLHVRVTFTNTNACEWYFFFLAKVLFYETSFLGYRELSIAVGNGFCKISLGPTDCYIAILFESRPKYKEL